jgi:DNA-binding PadR family transcriptional regulator
VAVSVLLLTGTVWISPGLRAVLTRPVGFDPNGLVVAIVQSALANEQQLGVARDLLRRLTAPEHGSREVAVSSSLPGIGASTFVPFHVRPEDPIAEENDRPRLARYAVSTDYFRVMGIPLLSGRPFTPGDEPAAADVIILGAGDDRGRLGHQRICVARRLAAGPPRRAHRSGDHPQSRVVPMRLMSSDPAPLSPPALHILLALGADAKHGYAIMRDIGDRSGGAIRLLPGTLYSTIKKLPHDGLIEETDPPRDADSDDARRRYYRVTTAGRAAAQSETRRLALLVKLGKVFLS